MAKVVGVRFRNVGKIYYFNPKNYKVKPGDHVIVETARGVEYGKVVLAPKDVVDDQVVHPLKEVLRVATKDDDEREKYHRERERDAFKICQKKIREHGLEMKLIDAEYTFDNNKVLFYFTADGRIDFRQLVKDLASIFKTRIELRQIGVRDETKILGGIGICGRCLCCHTYLSEFAPVSIRMAKEQNLSLNQTKISGVCGRLMCCLNFFTVYGPAGRPDMAYFDFTDKLLKGETIQIFNYGNCKRDFTYIDDIVEGIMRVMVKAPERQDGEDGLPIPPYKIYNIGNNQPENLLDFVQILQEELIRVGILPVDYDFESHKELVPMQLGDVPVTYADTTPLEQDFGFKPSTFLREGLHKFAEWYKEFYMK